MVNKGKGSGKEITLRLLPHLEFGVWSLEFKMKVGNELWKAGSDLKMNFGDAGEMPNKSLILPVRGYVLIC